MTQVIHVSHWLLRVDHMSWWLGSVNGSLYFNQVPIMSSWLLLINRDEWSWQIDGEKNINPKVEGKMQKPVSTHFKSKQIWPFVYFTGFAFEIKAWSSQVA